MRILFASILLINSLSAFAGGRHLYCAGENSSFDVATKGSRPSTENILVTVGGKPFNFKQESLDEDSSSYDFTILYLNTNANQDLGMTLKYENKNTYYILFKDGEVFEEYGQCQLRLE